MSVESHSVDGVDLGVAVGVLVGVGVGVGVGCKVGVGLGVLVGVGVGHAPAEPVDTTLWSADQRTHTCDTDEDVVTVVRSVELLRLYVV